MESPLRFGTYSPDSAHSANVTDEVLSCFICGEAFSTPKLVPKCGDVFCLQCVEKNIGSSEKRESFLCPKCGIASPLGANDPQGWIACVQVAEWCELHRRPASSVTPTAAKDDNNGDDDVCIHGPFLTTVCPHCDAEFCKICMLSHMDRMKGEAISVASSFQGRYDSALAKLDKTVGNRSKLFKEAIDDAEATIKAGTEQVLSDVKWDMDQMEPELMGAVPSFVTQKISRATAIVEEAKQIVENEKKTEKNKSLDDMTIEELSEMYAQMVASNEKIDAAIKLTKADFEGPLVLDRALVKKEVIRSIHESIAEEYVCGWTDILEFENAQRWLSAMAKLREFAEKGLLKEFREIFDSKDWSEDEIAAFLEEKDESNFGRSLLHKACEGGNVDLVRYLVEEKKAKIDTLDNGAALPVYVAAYHGRAEVVGYMLSELEKSCPSDFPEIEKYTFRFAVTRDHPKVIDLIYTRNKDVLSYKIGETDESWLHLAAKDNLLTVAVNLVKKGSDVYVVDVNGDTALHYACKHGHLELASYLSDIDPNLVVVRNSKGETAFDLAAASQHLEIINFLVERMGCAQIKDEKNEYLE